MEKNNKTYWPHMIIGFLFLGLTLGYWTLKSASNMPVEKENAYMMAYQDADMNINEIMASQNAFDAKYTIKLADVETIKVKEDKNSRLKQPDPVALKKGANIFSYHIVDKNGTEVKNAKVTFLLTRPHTDIDDKKIENIAYNGKSYETPIIDITKVGRYTLELKAQIGDIVGYIETPAFLVK
ncbi:MAG: hypothetical protein PHE73_00715 [Sulfurovaceae bacterium]|nr:hypothetical protein [Sulfurovaceae bacterium]